MASGIYRIVNVYNSKEYIGSTVQSESKIEKVEHSKSRKV